MNIHYGSCHMEGQDHAIWQPMMWPSVQSSSMFKRCFHANLLPQVLALSANTLSLLTKFDSLSLPAHSPHTFLGVLLLSTLGVFPLPLTYSLPLTLNVNSNFISLTLVHHAILYNSCFIHINL